MTAPTAPYAAAAGRSYGRSVEHIARLFALALDGTTVLAELPLTSASVTFDEGWSPYCQVQAVTPVPPDVATLDELDPRLGTRLRLDAGYVYPGGAEDVHTLADVDLRKRVVARPDNDVNLTAAGDEVLALDNRNLATVPTTIAATATLTAALTAVIALAAGPAPHVVNVTTGNAQLLGAAVTVDERTNLAALLTQLADRGNLWVYVDSARVWQITDRPVIASVPTLNATTGFPDSTITRAESTASSSEDWGNAVLVTFDDGTTTWAEVTSGPYSTAAVPRRVVEVAGGPAPTSPVGRAQVASTVLGRVASRGRGITFDAPAAYWVRPGQTITVQLPTGGQQRLLVARVTFTTQDGRMAVTTRQPDSFTITTGE